MLIPAHAARPAAVRDPDRVFWILVNPYTGIATSNDKRHPHVHVDAF
jgi:hypothetical protein